MSDGAGAERSLDRNIQRTLGPRQLARRRALLLLTIAFAVITLLTAFWVVGSTINGIIRSYFTIPLWDQWAVFHRWEIAQKTGNFLNYFFRQHNEHRIIIPRVFFVIDLLAFGGREVFAMAGILFIQTLHASLLFYLVAWNWKNMLWRCVCAGVIIMFMFSALQMANFVTGFQIQFVGVFLLASTAFAAVAHARSHSQYRAFGVAAAAGLAATFTMANGVLVWPLLIAIMVYQRWEYRFWWMATAIGALAVCAYFVTYQTPLHHPALSLSFFKTLALIKYVAVYIGSIIFVEYKNAMNVGLLGILLILIGTILTFFKYGRAIPKPALSLMATAYFILGTALATGLGRLEFGLEQAQAERYATPAYVYWISMGGLWLALVTKFDHGVFFIRCTASIVIGLILINIITAAVTAHDRYRPQGLARRQVASALLVGVKDPAPYFAVFATMPGMWARGQALREPQLSIFSEDWDEMIGRPIDASLKILQSKYCLGAFDRITSLSSSRNASTVAGWAWLVYERVVPEAVLIVDKTKIVRGIAFSGWSRRDVPAVLAEVRDEEAGWLGHAAHRKSARLRAFAASLDRKSACPLPGPIL